MSLQKVLSDLCKGRGGAGISPRAPPELQRRVEPLPCPWNDLWSRTSWGLLIGQGGERVAITEVEEGCLWGKYLSLGSTLFLTITVQEVAVIANHNGERHHLFQGNSKFERESQHFIFNL